MDHEFIQSTEKGASASLRNACQRCGMTREVHMCFAETEVEHKAGPVTDLMRYKAILTNVQGLERPQQCFTHYLDNLDTWMKGVLREHPEGIIEVYESVAILRHRVSARISETGGMVLDSQSLLDNGDLHS